jgi:Histidine kinase
MKKALNLVLLLVIWWAAAALVYTEQLLNMLDEAGQGRRWIEVLPGNLAGSMVWVPVTLGLIALVRRFPIERGNILRSAVILSAGVGGAIIIRGLFVYCADPIFKLWYDKTPMLSIVMMDSLRNNAILSWLIVGVAHAFHYFERMQAGRLRVAELEGSLARSQLSALSAQLNPHFLFNALNSVAELIHHNPRNADAMLIGLSELLRRSLRSSGEQEILLRDES